MGIADVDLYGGTRHSSARALRKHFSPEQIKRATMHSTNKAFERYFQIESDDVRMIYAKSSGEGKNQQKLNELCTTILRHKTFVSYCNYNIKMVGAAGFEPATSCSQKRIFHLSLLFKTIQEHSKIY